MPKYSFSKFIFIESVSTGWDRDGSRAGGRGNSTGSRSFGRGVLRMENSGGDTPRRGRGGGFGRGRDDGRQSNWRDGDQNSASQSNWRDDGDRNRGRQSNWRDGGNQNSDRSQVVMKVDSHLIGRIIGL